VKWCSTDQIDSKPSGSAMSARGELIEIDLMVAERAAGVLEDSRHSDMHERFLRRFAAW
jgi:hypothetical protein